MQGMGCYGKKQYKTEAIAQAVLIDARKRIPVDHVYKCHWGEHWHITKMTKKQAIIAQRLLTDKGREKRHTKKLIEAFDILRIWGIGRSE